MNKIQWCLSQKRGIKLVAPNANLSRAYLKKADEILENVPSTKGEWKLITAYYACYHALYSLLMLCGIKSEIHDCTLALMELFNFTAEETSDIQDLKDKRIQAQYYLKKEVLTDEYKVKEFVKRCKEILSKLDAKKIEAIRLNLKEVDND